MNEQEDPENNFRSRERALWPDEPPPFEEPFKSSWTREAVDEPVPPLVEEPLRFETQEPRENPWPHQPPVEFPFVPVSYTPETPDETVRQSGLAWSAGIVFFGSVAFMLFLGWLADLVLGSAPWGIVAGVVLGSIIGFIQFFRISSQIFAPKKSEHRPFLSRDDDEE